MTESYHDVLAWQKAVDLVTAVYAATKAFPKEELYGLTNQVRRAAVSVPSNIAEGKGRRSKREYIQFLYKARGSLHEVETQLLIAANLAYLGEPAFKELSGRASEVGRVLNGLIAKTQKQIDETTADS